ncbi:MAG: Histidine kinase [Clostridia bacterium 41_269]|nr:MAG: Histidine kinase [Clostridia bacterium 41_269]
MIKVKFPIFPVAVSGILFAVFFIISPLIPINFNSYVVVRNFIEFWAAVLIIILLLMAVYAFCCDRTLRYGLVSVFLAGAVLSQIFHIFSCPGMPDFITPNSMNKGYWFFLLSKFLLGAAFLVFAAGQSMQIKDIFCRFYLILLGLGEAAALLFILLRHRALPAVFSGFEVRLSLYRIILEAAALLLFLAAAYFLFTDISFKGNHSQNPNGKTAYILKGVIFYVLAYAFAFLIKLPAEIYFLLNHAFSAAALFFMFLGILSVSNIKNYFIGNTRSKQFLKQVENLSALGYITAGTVHEIRNSLTSVRGFLQVIKKNWKRDRI